MIGNGNKPTLLAPGELLTGGQYQIAGDGGYRIWVSAGGAQNNTVTSTIGTGSAVLSHVDDHAPHHHTISADATASGVSPTDGNLPPFVVINYIIKY